MDWKSRFRNAGFWVSLVAFLLMFLKTIGVDVGLPEYEFVDWVLGILVLLGIVSDPTTENCGWLDDR
ncbi:phage holin [Staphylospora marina]|uniref:phage holin n=1 Tax=Staphylospora marina TaxID=2490858 RepID=UPI000F5C1C2D|nr:phage holin [Staphylospora marina]